MRTRLTTMLRTVLTCNEKEPGWMEVYDVCYHMCRLVEGAGACDDQDLNNVIYECLNEAILSVWPTYAFKEGLSGYAELMEKRLRRIIRIFAVPPRFGRLRMSETQTPRDCGFILEEVTRLWVPFTHSMAKITCAHFERGMIKSDLLPPDMARLIASIAMTEFGL